MGSGGSQSLWPPSYEAGAVAKIVRFLKSMPCSYIKDVLTKEIMGCENYLHPAITTRAVIDGETLKREQSN